MRGPLAQVQINQSIEERMEYSGGVSPRWGGYCRGWRNHELVEEDIRCFE